MKTNAIFKVIVLNCLLAVLASSVAWADEEADKLKQLEQAMSAPPEKSLVKKPRTRAIVFDAAPQDAAAPAAEVAAKPTDCTKTAPDAKITAVDFAIQFKVGSAELTAPSEKTLKLISKVLSLSNNCILVEGHTDSAGNATRNMELSHQRAASVVKFISEKEGINQTRLVPVGKGSTEPLKDTDSHNPLNRRVVFKVVG
jgi:outer membrane protein OmpA-like peptidoglycan-associated protein